VSRPVPPELTLRPATVDDAPAMADLHVDCREANVPSMPAMVHDRATTHRWMRGRLEGDSTGWVAETEAGLVGYAVLTGDWLDDLFLAPGATGHGVGAALLDVAKAERPGGFCLWVFASNTGARRFYSRHGLVELETTDGRDNAEGAPDVRMAWPGGEPLGFFRRLIDDVDDQLGDLLARRAALTRATQPHKAVTTRDPAREQEVVSRLAARAPGLGEERIARIVHAIITESLDAAGPD
jgi:chorismate mutase